MDWLAQPLVCDGVVVAEPLDSTKIADADLCGICLRMHVILETIESPRCEGRLLPINLFDSIDTLESMVLYGHPSPRGHKSPPQLDEWVDVIREFGAYYHLGGSGAINVDPAILREIAMRYNRAPSAYC